MVEVSVAHTPVTVQVWLFTRSTRGTVQKNKKNFTFFRFFEGSVEIFEKLLIFNNEKRFIFNDAVYT